MTARPIRCAHCDSDRRSVSLWSQIIVAGDTVCCWLAHIEPPKPKRGTRT